MARGKSAQNESSILPKIAFLLLCVAFLFHLIAIGAPWWATAPIPQRYEHIGLWKYCSSPYGGGEACNDFVDIIYGGMPPSAATQQNEIRINEMIQNDRRVTVSDMNELEIGGSAVQHIINELGYSKVCARWARSWMCQSDPDFFKNGFISWKTRWDMCVMRGTGIILRNWLKAAQSFWILGLFAVPAAAGVVAICAFISDYAGNMTVFGAGIGVTSIAGLLNMVAVCSFGDRFQEYFNNIEPAVWAGHSVGVLDWAFALAVTDTILCFIAVTLLVITLVQGNEDD